MTFLTIDRVHKQYHGAAVLDGFSLEVREGELLTLLGPSGCGKSTLLRCIAGLEEMEGGSFFLDGQNITELAPQKRNVGMVFQAYALFPNLTVYENIAFGLRMRKESKSDIEQRVQEMLELIDLTDKREQYPHQLSGGQQQRVALARSLATSPKVLLLDEPLSALDAKIRKNLRTELRRIQKQLNMTMVFVTHDQEEALMISDRVCVMNEGKIVQLGEPEDIYTHPANEFVARFIGSYNVLSLEQLRILSGSSIEAGGPYALRPESIELTEGAFPFPHVSEREHFLSTGVVSSITVLGSIIRVEVETDAGMLSVDLLNDERRFTFTTGSAVSLRIAFENCRDLSTGGVVKRCPSIRSSESVIF